MARYDVYIVGCGGVGGHLVSLLPQTMACLMVDKAEPDQRERMLSSEGLDIPAGVNPFRRLVLIDGDRFSGHNALRQAAVTGSKLEVQMTRIRHSDVFSTWLNDTHLEGYDLYLTPENTDKVFEDTNNCVVFMGVDNHKTRYELSRYFETNHKTHRILLINGGNEKTTGNVTIWQRSYGEDYDPPLYKLYPDVNPNADKRPDEVACGTVAVNNDQTNIINNMIATVMINMFRKYVMADGSNMAFEQKLRQRGANNTTQYIRKNEVLIDLENNTMMALSHKRDTDNRRAAVTLENVPENAELN